MTRSEEQRPEGSRWGFRGKTLWDWLQLLIVPLALVAFTIIFTWLQDTRQLEIENQRAEVAREIEGQRVQDEALQAYLDQMNGLLIDKNLRGSEEESEVRTLARARTLTVLGRLDPSRKAAVMQFLIEANLVQRYGDEMPPTIRLSGVDLRGADLREDDLRGADLSNADLDGAVLSGTDLTDVDLGGVDLTDTDLNGADLTDVVGITNDDLE